MSQRSEGVARARSARLRGQLPRGAGGARIARFLAPACALLAACGKSGGGDARTGIEQDIARDLAAQLDMPIGRVRCPAGGYPKVCVAEIPGARSEIAGPKGGFEIAIVEGEDGLEWTLAGFVVSTSPLVAEIETELADLGLRGAIDCGPPARPAAIGRRLRCELMIGGVAGAAWVRILTEDSFDLELALDAETVAARTVALDDDELERRSRALDVDEALGDDDGEDDDGRDGGVDAAPTVADAGPGASGTPP